jgi:hypothetical protein
MQEHSTIASTANRVLSTDPRLERINRSQTRRNISETSLAMFNISARCFANISESAAQFVLHTRRNNSGPLLFLRQPLPGARAPPRRAARLPPAQPGVTPPQPTPFRMAASMAITRKIVVATVTSHKGRFSRYIGSPISRIAPKNSTRYGARMAVRGGERNSTGHR